MKLKNIKSKMKRRKSKNLTMKNVCYDHRSVNQIIPAMEFVKTTVNIKIVDFKTFFSERMALCISLFR